MAPGILHAAGPVVSPSVIWPTRASEEFVTTVEGLRWLVLCSAFHRTGGTLSHTRRLASLVIVAALLVAVISVPLRAVGPAILMFYGGELKEPVLVFPGNPSYNPTSFIWNPVNRCVPFASGKRGQIKK